MIGLETLERQKSIGLAKKNLKSRQDRTEEKVWRRQMSLEVKRANKISGMERALGLTRTEQSSQGHRFGELGVRNYTLEGQREKGRERNREMGPNEECGGKIKK